MALFSSELVACSSLDRETLGIPIWIANLMRVFLSLGNETVVSLSHTINLRSIFLRNGGTLEREEMCCKVVG